MDEVPSLDAKAAGKITDHSPLMVSCLAKDGGTLQAATRGSVLQLARERAEI